MNIYRSIWKCLIRPALVGALAVAFNQSAQSSPLVLKSAGASAKDTLSGFWYGTITGDEVYINFKTGSPDLRRSFTEGSFDTKDLLKFKENKGFFMLKEDIGSILFKGKFDGSQGIGHYKLTPNQNYIDAVKRVGIQDIDLYTMLQLACRDVTLGYLDTLADNGFRDVRMADLLEYALFKLTAHDINYWGHSGFKNMTGLDLKMAAIVHLDSAYTDSIRKIFPDILFSDLQRLKNNKVTPAYIEAMIRVRKLHPPDSTQTTLTPTDVMLARIAAVDSAYVRQMENLGVYLTGSDLMSFRNGQITPEYVKSLQDMGYKNLTPRSIMTMHAMGITPEFLREFDALGYTHLSQQQVIAFKQRGVTPQYIKSFGELGYTNIPADKLISMQLVKLSPGYVTELHNMGYKHIDLETLIALKTKDITPGYIASFNKLGFDNIGLEQLLQLKTSDVTPEYITAMRQKGLNSKDIRKYITLKNSFN